MKTEVSTKKLLEALLHSYIETHDLGHIYNGDGTLLTTLDEATKFVDGLKEELTSPKKGGFYKVPCSWEVYGSTVVEAESWDEAISIAESADCPLPVETSYVEDSFRIDEELVDSFRDENNP